MTEPIVSGIATTVAQPLQQFDWVVGKVAKLQLELQQQLPGYENTLHEIHVTLFKDEEITHLLSEEQIGIICGALAKKKGMIIAEAVVKGKGKNASLKQTTLDDI